VTVFFRSGHGSVTYEIKAGEEISIEVYTKSSTGAKFTVCDVDHKADNWVTDFEVKHDGDEEAQTLPSHETITDQRIKGPANIKVKADSNGSRWSSSNYLVAFLTY
jgi:hypothetical protein